MSALELAPPDQPEDNTSSSESLVAMRVDFALASGTRVLVYGWVRGLSETVASGALEVAGSVFDILADTLLVKRPDVTQSFHEQELAGDEHGFLALLTVPEAHATPDLVRLRIVLKSGASAETEWPVILDEAIGMATLRAHESALRPLIPRLSADQKQVLRGLGSQRALTLRADDLREMGNSGMVSLPVQVQLCAILPAGVLVVGCVLPRPLAEVTGLSLVLEGRRFDLRGGLVEVPDQGAGARPAAAAGPAYLRCSFLFVGSLTYITERRARDARIEFSCALGSTVARFNASVEPRDALARYAEHMEALDPNTRLEVYERISGLLRGMDGAESLVQLLARQMAGAVQALPPHLDTRSSPVPLRLCIDRSVQIADSGVFLIGWFYADPRARVRVICHAAEGSFNVSAHWVRWARPDVDKHLAEQGERVTEDPGFFCFIPLKAEKRPLYLSVGLRPGPDYRVRVALSPNEPVLQALRVVLSTVDPHRPNLRRLLDEHVGRAVGALWASRVPARQRAFVERFGPQTPNPSVSVVIPLFGRFDLADVQLALFANDPDFRDAELIYVVDDPAIVQEFRRSCPGLQTLYGLSITLAFPGENLGFPGACNFGANLARAPYLLLLNSDVMPKAAGWLSAILATYRAHPGTGLLGAKLLYEDGTVQQAGMESRRSEAWQDLVINHHSHKGLSSIELTGVMEVEGVSAACALVGSDIYRSLGGLSEDYILGEFEDSDFCHRARALGLTNRVDLDVVLYHLERQSQRLAGDEQWLTALAVYNCWLHNRRWTVPAQGVSA